MAIDVCSNNSLVSIFNPVVNKSLENLFYHRVKNSTMWAYSSWSRGSGAVSRTCVGFIRALVGGLVKYADYFAQVFPPSPCASLSPGTDSRQGLFLLLQGYALIMSASASMAAFFLR
jgi:hypothetical protein